MVANFAYYRHSQVAPLVVSKVQAYEQRFVTAVEENDKKALELWKENKTQAVEFLTAAAEDRGNSLVKDWSAFYQQLFMDFRDGNVPHGVTGGYAQDWYDRIAEETGDKYLVPESTYGYGGVDDDKMKILERYNRFGNAAGSLAASRSTVV